MFTHRGVAELANIASNCSLLYVRTFVLLTAVLCTFAVLLSNKETENADSSSTVNKKFVWTLLAIFIVINCCLKAFVYYIAYAHNYDSLYMSVGAMSVLERVNYICDIAVFLLLFAVLNTKIKKFVWKIVSVVTLSLVTTGIIMLENIIFLYRAGLRWYDYGDMTETEYIIRYFTPDFTTIRPPYIYITIGFALAFAVILICNTPKIKAKLISVLHSGSNWFFIEVDDEEDEIFAQDEQFTSIQKNEDTSEALK